MSNKVSSESRAKIRAGARKSAAIQAARKQHRIAKYDADPNLCPFCSEPIPYEKRRNKYCSHSCAAKTNNQGVVRNGIRNEPKPCLQCSKSTVNKLFCSKTCEVRYRWITKFATFEEQGMIDCSKSCKNARQYLLNKHGNCCSICGETEWKGQLIPLSVDHADGNPSNDRIENLRLVCGNCGMMLPTFAGRNAGNGRKSRRDFYARNGYS